MEYRTKSGAILTDEMLEEMGLACERGEYPGTPRKAIRKNIDITTKPTAEQSAMLTKTTVFPVRADDEYPEFSEAELLQFKKISNERKTGRQK